MSVGRRALVALVALATALLGLLTLSAPAANAYPPGKHAQCALNFTEAVPGQSLVITLTHYDPNALVTVTFHSAPVVLGQVTTDASGNASITVHIPANANLGGHVMVADQAHNTSTCPITVNGSGTGGTGGNNGGGGLSNTGVAVISVGSLGLLLLIGGAVMLLAGRRRKATV